MHTRGIDELSRSACLALVGLLMTMFVVKLYLGVHLDLFGDEAFYWQSAQRPALAYLDHPPLTAGLIMAGTAVLGDSTLGVRILFIGLGLAFLVLIWMLARPIVGVRDAWFAAGLSSTLPLASILGVAAVPDVPLTFFSLLAMVGLERATRTGKVIYWLVFGLALAGGLATHYRFILVPAAAGIYLLVTANGRQQWRRGGLWIAVAVGICGLLPVLLFNVEQDFAPLRYQFGERHAWQFNAKGLLQPAIQAAVTTPVLYLFFIITLLVGSMRALHGDDRAALLVLFAGFPIAVYGVLSPWSDQQRFSIHWPLGGYLPLLVLLPDTLRSFLNSGTSAWRKWVVWSAPSLGLVGVAGVFSYYLAVANLDRLYPILPVSIAKSSLAGWSELGSRTAAVLDGLELSEPANVIADHYYTGAQLEFLLGGRVQLAHLDEYKVHAHGRDQQYQIWGIDEASFRAGHATENALVIVDESEARYGYNRYATIRAICGIFDRLTLVDTADIFGGARRYRFYLGEGVRRQGEGRIAAARTVPVGENIKPFLPLPKSCPAPSFADIYKIVDDDVLTGKIKIKGWAINNASGVARVELLVDRKFVASVRYGIRDEGPIKAKIFRDDLSDPNVPNIGFQFLWDTGSVAVGRHELALRVVSQNGRIDRIAERYVFINRPNN